MTKIFTALWRLTRFGHALMLALAVLVGSVVALRRVPALDVTLLLALLVPVFSEVASFALNDLLDVESDKLNKKTDRPLVTGEISKQVAWAVVVLGFVLSLACAGGIGLAAAAACAPSPVVGTPILLPDDVNLNIVRTPFCANVGDLGFFGPAFIIALVFNLLAIAYNWKLKDLPLVGNVYIGATMAIPFLFGSAVYFGWQFSGVVWALAALGFFAGLGREIVKTMQDVEGDKKARGAKTLPVLIGMTYSAVLASTCYYLLVFLTIMMFLRFVAPTPAAVVLVALGDLLFVYLAVRTTIDQSPDFLKFSRKMSLVGLALGLLGLLCAALAI